MLHYPSPRPQLELLAAYLYKCTHIKIKLMIRNYDIIENYAIMLKIRSYLYVHTSYIHTCKNVHKN